MKIREIFMFISKFFSLHTFNFSIKEFKFYPLFIGFPLGDEAQFPNLL